jgi:hypothetical protein
VILAPHRCNRSKSLPQKSVNQRTTTDLFSSTDMWCSSLLGVCANVGDRPSVVPEVAASIEQPQTSQPFGGAVYTFPQKQATVQLIVGSDRSLT